MKKMILSLVTTVVLAGAAFAQAPQGVKYQAVVRDANTIVVNQAVGVQLTIQQGSIGGTAVYSETFSPTTNAYGLVNLEIGTGTTTDDFSAIDWSNGPYFIETGIDVTGGTSYTVMGTSQLMSVPYALYSNVADSVVNDQVDDADADPANEYNQTVVLNGTDLETTDGGGTIVTDLSPLVSAGGSHWTLTGNDISNSNTGNVGVGLPTPLHQFAVGRADTTTAFALGHIGNFNEVYSGNLIFSEDLGFAGNCGLMITHNGAANDLYIIGGCTTFEDTAMRINRSGFSNIRNLRVGAGMINNSNVPLTVDGISAFNGNMTITGDLNVTGNIAKGGGTFKIDHPLDPANKYLTHSFVESPEMMNVFSGNAVTDQEGYAIVEMPDYFEAANKDFRYQLTVIGSFAQAIIKEKISGNTFKIQTNQPNVEVSWMVTSVRSDKYAEANRVVPVSEKEIQGTYIHPELYNASPEQQENYVKAKSAEAKQPTRTGADGQ